MYDSGWIGYCGFIWDQVADRATFHRRPSPSNAVQLLPASPAGSGSTTEPPGEPPWRRLKQMLKPHQLTPNSLLMFELLTLCNMNLLSSYHIIMNNHPCVFKSAQCELTPHLIPHLWLNCSWQLLCDTFLMFNEVRMEVRMKYHAWELFFFMFNLHWQKLTMQQKTPEVMWS